MTTPGKHTKSGFAVLLWAALLVCGQTLAVAHQHADDVTGTPCVVCSLAKAQTAACGSPPAQADAASPSPAPQAVPVCAHPTTLLAPYESRAPPRS